MALAWAGRIEGADGPPIYLYSPLPRTQKERDAVPIGDVSDWLQRVGINVAEERWMTLLNRQ